MVADGIQTRSLKYLGPCRGMEWIVRCAARNEKNVRMRAYGEVLSVHRTPSIDQTTLH